ncbi:MAG: hypothetical protein J7K85_06670 [Anaerolineaceae bacterium]|nr:hypothetical protein [Anaerolineaceae bacterium]
MSIKNLIILSQLNPPAQRNHVLNRERITNLLHTALDYPLTIIKAGTGYGKSTAIISFLNTISLPVYWYSMSGPDRDPTLFLAKLFSAFNQHGEEVGEEALRILDMPDSTQQEAMITFINAISIKITHPSLLILDDFHRVYDVPEITVLINWMIENLPPNLHLIIATRRTPQFSSLNKWRVKGILREIGNEELMFSSEEIFDLFNFQYGIPLQSEEIEQLHQKTEGWAIGLQMVWQSIQNNPRANINQVLDGIVESKTALFDYLAEEVLNRLDAEIQNFLLKTSLLSKLDSTTCDFLLTTNQSDQTLRQLHQMGLFIEELQPNVYRYHQMFREFLQNRLHQNPAITVELHRKIASYFTAHEYWERALSHLLLAGDYHQVNQVLENIGEQMIQEGRYESIRYWINAFPETIRKNYPYITFLLGEVNRYMSHFELALECYHSVERQYRAIGNTWGISMALRGQARVFLDTVRPANADHLLQEALKLLNPQETPEDVADLLSLIAENQLNLGYPDKAEELLHQSNEIKKSDTENDLIQARIFLRTGRLKEGIELLEKREAQHPTISSIARPQRFHREASLMLSLFYAIQGNIDMAYHFAQQGITIGEQLQSTFVQSVGYMRLGHALQLQNKTPWTTKGFDQAVQYYQESMDKIEVTKIHVEPLWGMCRALGYSGRVNEAETLALESLSIAQKAGDQWISVLTRISLGAGEVLAKNYEKAHHYLTLAESGALKVSDPFALTAAQMWLALNAWQQGFLNSAFVYLEKLLQRIKENHYEFLLKKETFLGLNDREIIIPLLLAAKKNNIESDAINEILKSLQRNNLDYHPGYTLWVRTLDTFNVWCGTHRIRSIEWKREKAKHLFQLLVANHGKWLHRDQIMNMLWPESGTTTATNNLKVVLNTLNQVLEPGRPRGETPFFIERQRELYRLNPTAHIIIDTDIFEVWVLHATEESLSSAIELYQTHYFNDSYVQEWLVVEEQYYHQKFLLAAEKLTQLLFDNGKLQEALDVTYKILAEDNLWESAYQFQMVIFHKMKRFSMVHSVYEQCKHILEKQYNRSVSTKLTEIYENLVTEGQD